MNRMAGQLVVEAVGCCFWRRAVPGGLGPSLRQYRGQPTGLDGAQ
jgi:hypothetical protein